MREEEWRQVILAARSGGLFDADINLLQQNSSSKKFSEMLEHTKGMHWEG